ncbi:DUF1311 domain-containing protein [Pseudoxanthomonas sp. PXM02]|nr:DUF1311 domain-containing protein [Pseudoxanthomonas sp. PXM02]
MNICAFRDFVASDLELDAVMDAKRASALPQCLAGMDRKHAAWETKRDKACLEETEEDKGGSMYPMLLSSCKTEATRERISFVKQSDSCSLGR